ncbi:MAG: DNA-binding transcriptional regulator Fis [Spongiibacteraceae bacterium]
MKNTETFISSAAPVNTGANATAEAQAQTLRDSVSVALKNYFQHLDGQPVTDVYNMVLSEIEAPLLEEVLRHTRSNQTKAAVLLGLNRGTLRKKLKQYGLL